MCLGYYRYVAASRPEIVPRVQGIVHRYPFDMACVWYEYKSSQVDPTHLAY